MEAIFRDGGHRRQLQFGRLGRLATRFDQRQHRDDFLAGVTLVAARFGHWPAVLAPESARVVRPLVLIFTAINLFVTWLFHADVEAQGGAYATGVLVLISSACVATVIDRYRSSKNVYALFRVPWRFVMITAIFFYTTGANMVERPDGVKIAS